MSRAKQKVSQEKNSVNKDRRRLLKVTGAIIASAPVVIIARKFLRDDYAFLDRQPNVDTNNLTWLQAEKLYTPIGPKKLFTSESRYEDFAQLVRSEISSDIVKFGLDPA